MRILVVGGTLFVGRVFVEHALASGHEVTLFNRGKTNPGLFPNAEQLIGDRDSDLLAVEGRDFDAVLDTSAYYPRQIITLLAALGEVGHFTFVSSCSAYADHSVPYALEDTPLAVVDDPSVEELGENYGGFKALCEAAAEAALPGHVLNARPGLIVGPHDNTGRFTYWVERLARGGNVLAPEDRNQPVQFIDVRDLATWMLHCMENEVVGVMNANRPPDEYTVATMLEHIQAGLANSPQSASGDATFTWVGEDFLMEQEVGPWGDLPLWLPHRSMPTHAGFLSNSTERAQANGLITRPVEETARATLQWLQQADPGPAAKDFGNEPQPAGLTPERERELLDLWIASQQA